MNYEISKYLKGVDKVVLCCCYYEIVTINKENVIIFTILIPSIHIPNVSNIKS